jgi:hypothetical protein
MLNINNSSVIAVWDEVKVELKQYVDGVSHNQWGN